MSKTSDILDNFQSPMGKIGAAVFILSAEIAKVVVILHFVIKYW